MKHRRLVFLLVLCVSTAGMAFAQLTPTGKIIGKVVDNQGGPLPGVTSKPRATELVGKAATISDANGVYRLMALPSGTFEIVFSLSGFKTLIRKGIVLELSQTLTLNVTLEQAAVEEQVTVVGQSPLIDVKSTVKGQTMTKEIFMTLPRGRNFDSLISTIPGVQNEGITAGLSVDGASGAENMWYADGADITDFHYGDRGQSIVLELLDEVKVTASGYNAEFGGSMGGVVNVITKSGSNEFHGDIIGYYENNRTVHAGEIQDLPRGGSLPELRLELRELRRRVLQRREGPGQIRSVRRRVRPRRLYHQGQAVVLRDVQPDLQQRRTPSGTSREEGALPDVRPEEHRPGRIDPALGRPGQGPSPLGQLHQQFHQLPGEPCPPSTASAPRLRMGEGRVRLPEQERLADRGLFPRQQPADQLPGRLARAESQQPADRPSRLLDVLFRQYELDVFANDPFFLANPDLIKTQRLDEQHDVQETKRYLRGKISNNVDVSLYLNWVGEHALKAGVGYNYLYEDRFTGYTHPRVTLYWGQTNDDLEFTVGAGADPSSPYYGKYGYYLVRSSFTSPSGSVWNVTRATTCRSTSRIPGRSRTG